MERTTRCGCLGRPGRRSGRTEDVDSRTLMSFGNNHYSGVDVGTDTRSDRVTECTGNLLSNVYFESWLT